jgi:hypothetical protein
MVLLRTKPNFGTGFAAKSLANVGSFMKTNVISRNKLALVCGAICAATLAFSQNAAANRHPLPPVSVSDSAPVSVPDGGATVMLLGTALGALGVARRFLKS